MIIYPPYFGYGEAVGDALEALGGIPGPFFIKWSSLHFRRIISSALF